MNECCKAATKAEVKDERRKIRERLAASSLPNKDEIMNVIFPPTPPAQKQKWVDLSVTTNECQVTTNERP